MLSLTSARALRDAGLAWEPQSLDFFAIPMAGFEDQVFAINDMTIMAEPIRGKLAITFHGTVEWALDHLWAGEVIWLPREEQLRELLEGCLGGEPQPALALETSGYGYRCTIRLGGQVMAFEAFEASEAYAAALLHVLRAGSYLA